MYHVSDKIYFKYNYRNALETASIFVLYIVLFYKFISNYNFIRINNT